jgi:N-acetylmuramoyl-L-alanine amidase
MLVIIDAGHGGDEPGAVCPEFNEKEMNLKISLYQFERFKELGVDVGMTRTTDKTLPLSDRGHIVRTSGAKVCLCNHNNAATTPKAEGATAIYSVYSDGKLAKMILDEIVEEGQKIREAYTRAHTINKGLDYYYMHRETGNVETVIIEYAFLTNVEDRKKIRDNYQRYAEAAIRATCAYLGISYHPANQTQPESPEEEPTEGLWVIQAGAFKNEKKAHEHARKLMDAGFSAFVYKKKK